MLSVNVRHHVLSTLKPRQCDHCITTPGMFHPVCFRVFGSLLLGKYSSELPRLPPPKHPHIEAAHELFHFTLCHMAPGRGSDNDDDDDDDSGLMKLKNVKNKSDEVSVVTPYTHIKMTF